MQGQARARRGAEWRARHRRQHGGLRWTKVVQERPTALTGEDASDSSSDAKEGVGSGDKDDLIREPCTDHLSSGERLTRRLGTKE